MKGRGDTGIAAHPKSTLWGHPIERWELAAFASVLVLKLYYLFGQWGQAQGYDVKKFFDVISKITWVSYPGIREGGSGYHPPLAFIIVWLIARLTADPIGASQALSALSVAGAWVLMRQSVKMMDLLYTFRGFVFVYLSAAIPCLLYLSAESTYDSLILFWGAEVFCVSVALFMASPTKRMRWVLWTLLFIGLVGGLMTKVTGVLDLAIPVIVHLIGRRSDRGARMRMVAVLGLAVLTAFPYYYLRNYRNEGTFFPISMTWEVPESEQRNWIEWHRHPLSSIAHILRFPGASLLTSDYPDHDALISTVWFTTWKRENYGNMFGPHGQLSATALILSEVYLTLFIVLGLFGFTVFVRRCSLKEQWSALGVLLLLVFLLYASAQVAFAFRFPMWGWEPIKAKYVAIGLFWFTYCIAQGIEALVRRERDRRMRRAFVATALTLTMLFVIANHIVPVS